MSIPYPEGHLFPAKQHVRKSKACVSKREERGEELFFSLEKTQRGIRKNNIQDFRIASLLLVAKGGGERRARKRSSEVVAKQEAEANDRKQV